MSYSGGNSNHATLARGFFSVPLSPTSSERMFSASGNIVSISRMNLTPETASALTYVQQKGSKVKVHNWDYFFKMTGRKVKRLM